MKYKFNGKGANLFKKFPVNVRPVKNNTPVFDPNIVKNRLSNILSSKSESFD